MPDAPRCRNCRRVLRDPDSRTRGYGPKCWADRQPPRPQRTSAPILRTPRPGDVPGQLELAEEDPR